MLEVIVDALKDSLIVFPFLFAVYMIMEIIESAKYKEKIEHALQGKYAPLVASTFGIVPECGFSVMCAKFFDSGYIAIGTLIAAFIATNDEGLIVLISEGASISTIGFLILWKVIYALFIGVLLNVVLKKFDNRHVCPISDDCMECGEHHGGTLDKFVFHPFHHAAKTFICILCVNLVLNTAFHFIGEDNINKFLSSSKSFGPLITALFGIIPNCASSIVLAEGFMSNLFGFSSLIAGLVANSGVGLLVLFKNGKSIKKALLIAVIMYLSGVGIGYLTMLC